MYPCYMVTKIFYRTLLAPQLPENGVCVSDASHGLVMLGHTTESSATGTPAQCRLQITPISYANPHWHRRASLKSTETSKCNVWERGIMHWSVTAVGESVRKRDRRVDCGRVKAMMKKSRERISKRKGSHACQLFRLNVCCSAWR